MRHDVYQLYKEGVRIIVYPNGHRTELYRGYQGLILERPIATPEEKLEREIAVLKEDIQRKTARLAELEGK